MKDSGSSLFAYTWESQKGWDLVEGVAHAASNGIKKHSKSVGKKASRVGKLVADIAGIGPLVILRAGLGLTSVFVDQFKRGKKSAKLAGQLLAYTLAMGLPFLT